MEVLDQDDPSYFWVGKVVRSVGFRLIVHLEGDSNLTNIEVHYLSESVHHLGWGFQAGLQLKPPKGKLHVNYMFRVFFGFSVIVCFFVFC